MKRLTPFFCGECGNRLGWQMDKYSTPYSLFCDSCSKDVDEEIDAEIRRSDARVEARK